MLPHMLNTNPYSPLFYLERLHIIGHIKKKKKTLHTLSSSSH